MKLSQLATLNPTSGTDILYCERGGLGYQVPIANLSGFNTDQTNVFTNIFVTATGNINRILGGAYLTHSATGYHSAVLAGSGNQASGSRTVVCGGRNNQIREFAHSFIGGGLNHFISGEESAVVGGDTNTIQTNNGFVGGGDSNTVVGPFGAIPGGQLCAVNGSWGLAAGYLCTASGNYSVALGDTNTASGADSVALGFSSRTAGQYSLAAGRAAVATRDGAFVLGDSTSAAKQDNGADTLTFHFQSGVFVTGAKSTLHRTFGSVVVGSGLKAEDTHGFLYLPWTTGVMSSTPSAQDSMVPFIYDTGNDKLRAYNPGSRKWVGFPDIIAASGVSPVLQSTGSYTGLEYTLTTSFARVGFDNANNSPQAALSSAGTWLVFGNFTINAIAATTSFVQAKLYNSSDSIDVQGSQARVGAVAGQMPYVSLVGIHTVTASKNVQLWAKMEDTASPAPFIHASGCKLVAIKLNSLT